jgi:hypothetical protein
VRVGSPTDSPNPSLAEMLSMTTAMCGGLMAVYFIPFFIGIMERSRALPPEKAAFLGSAEIACAAVTAVFLGRIGLVGGFATTVVLGGALGVLSNGISIGLAHFAPLLTARVLAGIGEGLLFGAATMAVARQDSPDRIYGRVYGWCAIFFTVTMMLLPYGLDRGGVSVYFLMYIAVAVLAAACAPVFRRLRIDLNASLGGKSRAPSRPSALLYLVLAALFVPIGALWGLADQIAHSHGISLQATGIALSVSNAGGFIGGELSRRMGLRSGMFAPIAVCTAALILVALGQSGIANAVGFIIMMGALGVIYLFLISHVVSIAASFDRTGGLAAGINGASLICLSVGPPVFETLLSRHGVGAMLLADVALCLVALIPAWMLRSQSGSGAALPHVF